jgi:anti-sigma regulatory factor (Ser/Thr protein kinase)
VSLHFTASYEPALDTPALARHQLEGWLPETLHDSHRGALRLLVSELVTNSVRHVTGSKQPVELAVRIGSRMIRVEVRDGGSGFEPGKPEPRGADGGFGLYLVERMASRWGVDTRDGTRVWFELDLRTGGH